MKIKAFVHFKEIKKDDQSFYMDWHRPDHSVLKFSAPFFTDRFKSMRWINNKLEIGPGISQRDTEAFDQTEELWKTYYASIFNPGRVKIKMMKAKRPVRYWKTLPESELIDLLIAEAPARLEAIGHANHVVALSELKTAHPNCRARKTS